MAILTLAFIFAGANPFDIAPVDAIAVDIVSPDEIARAANEAAPPETTTAFASLPPATAIPETAAGSPLQPATRAVAEHDVRQAATQSPPQPAKTMSLPQSSQSAAQPPGPADMFGLPLALPDGRPGSSFDAPAIDKANIANDDIAAFRNHLKTCSTLPAGVNKTDDVRAVLRIHLNPDGTLAARPEPIRIEGVSRGGGALYQSAVAALRKCQPYNMLPPDKYNDWKVFDLSFTPQNFAGG